MASVPPISVVVPCFNAADTLEETLISIIDQTLPPCELIVVNDGSTDSSLDVLQRYAFSVKEKISIRIVDQENRGVSAARNAGVRIAKGELICFLDADDTWHPEKLYLQAKALQSASPDYQAVALVGIRRFATDFATGNREYLRDSFLRVDPTMSRRERVETILALENSRMALASTFLCPRAVFLDVGGWDEDLTIAEDWDLLSRLVEVLPLASVEQPLLYYRKHASSVTACYMDYRRLERQQFKMLCQYAERSDLDRKVRRRLAAQHVQDFLSLCSNRAGVRNRLTLLGLLARQVIYEPSTVRSRQFYSFLRRSIS